jgi:hypothetical protein
MVTTGRANWYRPLRAAGDEEPHNDRNQTETHDLLPWCITETFP